MLAPDALSGIRVLDLSRILAAPWATQMLGDLGADVIKVEKRGGGDEARLYGPDRIIDKNGRRTAESAFFISTNRNKRSICIDLAKPEGSALVRRLVSKCDVVVENFLVGTTKRFGIDYDSLSAINPRLIYCSLTGYGQDGPYSPRPGYDAVFQAQGGMMSTTGLPDDVPGGGPMKTGPSLVDITTGYNAAIGILGALLRRERHTGQGQYIDVALLDASIAMQSHVVQNYLLSGTQPPRLGTTGNGGHPARVFHCRDGDIYISAGSQKHYELLCDVLGLAALKSDARYATTVLRFQNRKDWNDAAEPEIARWEKGTLSEALVSAGVPCSVINEYVDVFADPQVVHRGVKKTIEHPLSPSGSISIVANPIRLSESPVRYRQAPPLLGEHTREVLQELLSMSDQEIGTLKEGEVI